MQDGRGDSETRQTAASGRNRFATVRSNAIPHSPAPTCTMRSASRPSISGSMGEKMPWRARPRRTGVAIWPGIRPGMEMSEQAGGGEGGGRGASRRQGLKAGKGARCGGVAGPGRRGASRRARAGETHTCMRNGRGRRGPRSQGLPRQKCMHRGTHAPPTRAFSRLEPLPGALLRHHAAHVAVVPATQWPREGRRSEERRRQQRQRQPQHRRRRPASHPHPPPSAGWRLTWRRRPPAAGRARGAG